MKLRGYKYEILARNKYKSTKSTNSTVLQSFRKVAKWEEASHEALVKFCVMKFFSALA